MSRARDNANNWAADITGVTAGTGITGGGTSGAVTVTNDMATTIDAKGDLVVGSGADTYVRVAVGSNNQVLTADSATTSGVKWATADALPSQTGNSGKYLTTNGTTASWGTVNQPITWTNRATFQYGINSIAYNGTDLYVAVGSNERLLSSPDGVTWTERTSGFTGGNSIIKVAFGNGLWVAVGGGGQLSTSSDGTTWTARTANMSTNTINDVLYANSIWVAVGAGGGTTNTGGITYSTNGTTWTRKSQSLTVGSNYATVMYNGTNWIVGASNSTNNYLYASTPSGTWTAASTSTGLSIRNFFYDGTRSLEVVQDGSLRYSTSTTVGTTTQMTGIQLRGAGQYNYYYNGRIYSIGQSLISVDTTPVTGDYGKVYPPIFPPTIQNDFNGTFKDGSQAIFVGSAGYIVVSVENGISQIFTSF
jgi:hypothetical protein